MRPLRRSYCECTQKSRSVAWFYGSKGEGQRHRLTLAGALLARPSVE